MRSVKLNRVVSFTLALLFCFGLVVIPAEPETAEAASGNYVEPDVRIGIYVGSNSVFSAWNTSNSGSFEIGYSSDGFNRLFTVNAKQIVLLPQTNASFGSSSKTAYADSKGTIGAYSAVISRHGSYAEAEAVAKTVKNGFVAVVNGGFEARGFSGNSADAVKKAAAGRTVVSPAKSGLLVLDNSGKILFSYEDSSRRLALKATGGSTVTLPFGSGSYSYYGYMEYCNNGNSLQLINCVGLETYVKCVMSIEIGTFYSTETRKAFSIMARTFVLRRKHGDDFYCCSTDCCQVYLGTYRWDDHNAECADATRGLYCAYNGQPILAVYHNSNGGASCSSLAAWGGSDLPYLKTVYSEENGETEIWDYEFTKEEFYDYLKSRSKFSSLEDSDITIKIDETDPHGSDYITKLTVSDGSGNTVTVKTAESIRVACGFESANFDFEYSAEMPVLTSEGRVENAEITGILTENGFEPFDSFEDSFKTTSGEEIAPEKITINGKGTGHGVGFSVFGSEELAKEGYNYEYILFHYFQNTTLETVS